ncbi:ATP-binding protein [Paludicola sp. MB14-C6]|uniref:ATP-binding protein n=1 Tax=Paludihabitans sp. MB14-C6 TaxID=3070656 RepID=UPI0027DE7407|nr:ATP-binding protein [Paludicola sp. MB14-C6]WMJ23204.1 ATP-binding protein [Paludicola sp. MB14-C6]
MIERKEYLSELISLREKQIIKVVTGVRRCGKSTLFKLYQDYLLSTGVLPEQIISINLEDLDFEELLDYKKLYAYIKERLCKDKYTYIFLDEIQNCKDFEKAVDSLFIKENTDVYITGSNAYMLSGELATLLSGRYVTIAMLPLSFKEYVIANNESNKSTREHFADYLRFGSFPYLAAISKDEPIMESYIDGIYNTILVKDVAKREGITDISLLESIVKVMASSIGSPVSTKKISDTINSAGRKTSVNSIDSYMKALCDAYIFYKVDRFDIKGRQHLKTLGKYYIVDTGIRNLLLSSGASDIGHLIENVAYFELVRRGYKVNIGKLSEKEVDFVAKNSNGLEYYQISASVLDETTLRRELSPLESIQDHFPKILLTLDEVPKNANFNGIRHLNLIDWLLDE